VQEKAVVRPTTARSEAGRRDVLPVTALNPVVVNSLRHASMRPALSRRRHPRLHEELTNTKCFNEARTGTHSVRRNRAALPLLSGRVRHEPGPSEPTSRTAHPRSDLPERQASPDSCRQPVDRYVDPVTARLSIAGDLEPVELIEAAQPVVRAAEGFWGLVHASKGPTSSVR
jgi:hypothetical protein